VRVAACHRVLSGIARRFAELGRKATKRLLIMPMARVRLCEGWGSVSPCAQGIARRPPGIFQTLHIIIFIVNRASTPSLSPWGPLGGNSEGPHFPSLSPQSAYRALGGRGRGND
jgi:hypothetical protein